jgi:hypothetical protein
MTDTTDITDMTNEITVMAKQVTTVMSNMTEVMEINRLLLEKIEQQESFQKQLRCESDHFSHTLNLFVNIHNGYVPRFYSVMTIIVDKIL